MKSRITASTATTTAGHRGSAVLIVLVLISAMLLIVLANCTTLYWMKREILRIEARQQRPRPPAAGLVPAVAPKPAPPGPKIP